MSNKDFLMFSIFTFLTVVIWTIFDAYHVHKASSIPESLQMQIEQITPTFDRETVEKIKSRYNESALPTPEAINITPTIIPTPTVKAKS